MSRSFVHLHVHTLYSLLDGANRISPLVKAAKKMGMPAIAITDHDNMFGAIDFFKSCRAEGIKPIIGTEISLVPELPPLEEALKGKRYHLTLLSRSLEGYRNLMRLSSMSYLEGKRSDYPLADHAMLSKYHKGLIALSGDLGGEISQAILQGKSDVAADIAGQYQEIFGKHHFYLEVMDNAFPEQTKVNEELLRISKKNGIPLVATNDCHYLKREEAAAHALLMCIQLGKTVELSRVMSHGIDSFYLKSPQEMWSAFSHVPEACENTLKIADMVDVTIPLGQVCLPRYKVPEVFRETHSVIDDVDLGIHLYFVDRTEEGLENRFTQFKEQGIEIDAEVYRKRLAFEINVIREMEFPGYFLIVWDFINWSKDKGIPVGPGRGSGAGSLVAYSLGITDIDPLRYGLIFERFLNPERVSMPDFDIDFCMHRRGEVIDYVTKKYGKHNVGQIVTFGSLKARVSVKDVGRALNFAYGETDRIAKLIPDEIGITLAQAKKKEPQLRALINGDPRVASLYQIAEQLEGLYRQTGIHAAGIVISEDPLWEYVPVIQGSKGEIFSQFAKNEVEQAGLVKFDFLGLKTLTVVDLAIRFINEKNASKDTEPFDISMIPMHDAAVFALISSGKTTGVFQLESSGFQELLMRLKPDSFEDIIAAVALYRPGPLGAGMVDDFIDRKHGKSDFEYLHPWLEEMLKETYGVFVYQEQVMKSAQVLAGFSLGGADLMRRAMGKKKPAEMEKQRAFFVDGAEKKGVAKKKASEIFNIIASFAGYGFNKSHSAAYALITYQTAFLKAHHPVEFYAALMSCDRENTDKVVRTIHDARSNKIQVLPPNLNASGLDFSVDHGKIRFGLGAIKGLGQAAIEAILEVRKEKPFSDFFDFYERVDLKRINKRVVDALIKSGGFDSIWPEKLNNIREIGIARAKMSATTQQAMERAQRSQRDKKAGQTSLFSMFASVSDEEERGVGEFLEAEPWSDQDLLKLEKATLGFYVTGHPLDRYASEMKRYANSDSSQLSNVGYRDQVTLGGVVIEMRERTLKNGVGRMAFLTLEDKLGQVEVLCFSKMYPQYEEVIKSGLPILVRGQIKVDGDGDQKIYKLRATEVTLLTAVRQKSVKKVIIKLTREELSKQKLRTLATLLKRHQGRCKTYLRISFPKLGWATISLPQEFHISPTDELIIGIERLFGDDKIFLH